MIESYSVLWVSLTVADVLFALLAVVSLLLTSFDMYNLSDVTVIDLITSLWCCSRSHTSSSGSGNDRDTELGWVYFRCHFRTDLLCFSGLVSQSSASFSIAEFALSSTSSSGSNVPGPTSSETVVDQLLGEGERKTRVRSRLSSYPCRFVEAGLSIQMRGVPLLVDP